MGSNPTVIDTANNLEVEARNGNKIAIDKANGYINVISGSGATSDIRFKTNGVGGAYMTFNENNGGSNALMLRTYGSTPQHIWLNTGNAGNIQFNAGESNNLSSV